MFVSKGGFQFSISISIVFHSEPCHPSQQKTIKTLERSCGQLILYRSYHALLLNGSVMPEEIQLKIECNTACRRCVLQQSEIPKKACQDGVHKTYPNYTTSKPEYWIEISHAGYQKN